MAQVLDAYQSWLLSVRNAINADQPIPIPPYSPPMTIMERDLWQTHVKQVIHSDTPPTPAQWLAARAQVRSVASIQQAWNDLAAARVAAQAQAQDAGGQTED
jgi:hypothetical protein